MDQWVPPSLDVATVQHSPSRTQIISLQTRCQLCLTERGMAPTLSSIGLKASNVKTRPVEQGHSKPDGVQQIKRYPQYMKCPQPQEMSNQLSLRVRSQAQVSGIFIVAVFLFGTRSNWCQSRLQSSRVAAYQDQGCKTTRGSRITREKNSDMRISVKRKGRKKEQQFNRILLSITKNPADHPDAAMNNHCAC